MNRLPRAHRGFSTLFPSLAILAGCSLSPNVGAVPVNTQNYVASSALSSRALALVSSATYKTTYNFIGETSAANPNGNLVELNGELYGVSYSGGNQYGSLGTILKIDKFGKAHVLYRFAGGADGASPEAGLVNVNGMLYGTTATGGNGCSGGCGTIFESTPSGNEKVLYSFRGGTDGAFPSGTLAYFNGVLYGTNQGRGNSGCRGYGCGTVFAIRPDGNGYHVLHRFAGGSDGAGPFAGPIAFNGKLYGTTEQGGSTHCKNGCGTVYEISPGGAERVVYAFKAGRDGAQPIAGLIAANALLYGTTDLGGKVANCGRTCGTIFEVSPSGSERVIYRFAGGIKDGQFPQTPLFYQNGIFYGTTSSGGHCYFSGGCGTTYAVYAPGRERMLHVFAGPADGAYPQSGLAPFNGALYGTTGSGGSSPNCGTQGCGTIYRLTP